MLEMPVLETARLIVRPFVLDDLDVIHPILNVSFGEVPLEERREWLQWATLNHVALARLYQPPYGDRAMVLKASGAVIGSVGLVPAFGTYRRLPSFRRDGEAEDAFVQPEFALFWAVAPAHQRQGYAVEAAQGLIDWAFKQFGIRRIIAETGYDNVASQGVMQRLGMTVERNPKPEERPWFQVVGVLYNPAAG